MRLLLLAAVLFSACAGSPAAPSTPSAFYYPPELQAVVDFVDAAQWIHPLIGEPSGQWMRTHVVRIEMSDHAAPNAALAHYDRRVVLWNPTITPNTQGVPFMASSLLHEIRHLQGYRHTCGNKDRTFDEGGAFAVQILWLEHYGLLAEANSLRREHIGC